MPRPLRIEYEGARYHVMCRGNRGTTVFGSDEGAGLFLKTLDEVCARTGWKVHAWVLMSTHYHLLLDRLLHMGDRSLVGRSRSIVERNKDFARRCRSLKRALDKTKTTQITG